MKRIWIFLGFSFAFAWLLWIGCYIIEPGGIAFQIVSIVAMWAPTAALGATKLITGKEKMLVHSAKPKLRGILRWYAVAWLLPIFFTLSGAALYFYMFPQQFDTTLEYLHQMILAQTGQNFNHQLLFFTAIMQIMGALGYAPLLNMFAAFGEEAGWRGFLYPELAKQISPFYAHIIVGVVWGLWHTPINMMGHNYGVVYKGYPWAGILVMCLFTTSAGIFLSWITQHSKNIWPAALAHGSINAAAGIPFIFVAADNQKKQILGPGLSGLVTMLPMVLFAAILLFVQNRAAIKTFVLGKLPKKEA